MALKMKEACERCAAPSQAGGPATICSFECNFCAACARLLKNVCPNCGGELVIRPRPKGDTVEM